MTSLHHEGFENESDGKALTIDFLTKRIATKNHIARLREDVVVSQAISGLCESFRLKLFLYAERLQNVIDNTQDANDLDWRWKNMFDIYEFCGYSAGIFFAGSLVPQVHKSYVTKNMDDISYGWQILLIIALLMSLVYSIHMNLPPVYISTFLELIFMIT